MMSQQQQKESGVCILYWEEGEFPLNVGKPSVQIHPRTSQHLGTRHKFAEASCSHRRAKMKSANSQDSPLGEVTCAPIQSRTYMCSWRGDVLCFTVDLALGFTCSDSKTKNVLWRFRFSQLKGSSDDGNARVKLLFQHLDTKQIEVKELEFPDLTAVLHCVHAFLAAKVASVDATFLDGQSFARKVLLLSAEH